MENKLRQLTKSELGEYKKLGTATGTFEVCLHMANKHVSDFTNRVVGFYIEENGMSQMVDEVLVEAGLNKEKSMDVTFYEEKDN